MSAVSDSSPLIYLAALGDFDYLRKIFGSIVIPPSVYREVVIQADGFAVKNQVEQALGVWLNVAGVEDDAEIIRIAEGARIEVGEAAAIVLAKQVRNTVLMDDQRAVTHARAIGLHVIRTPMIYAEAKLRAWIPEVRGWLD